MAELSVQLAAKTLCLVAKDAVNLTTGLWIVNTINQACMVCGIKVNESDGSSEGEKRRAISWRHLFARLLFQPCNGGPQYPKWRQPAAHADASMQSGRKPWKGD